MPASRPFIPYDGAHYDAHQSIGYQMAKLMLAMRRELEARMAEHGLTDAQWKPLWILKTRQTATTVELAREIDMDAGAVTRLVDRLEAKGLVERVRSEADRRVVHLRLTPAGDQACEQVPQVLAGVNNDFLRGFTESEWKQLRELIGRMAANGNALQAGKVNV
jgi:DNA-binding MarR family transcriptional regulator